MNTDLRDDDGFADRLTAYLDQRAARQTDQVEVDGPGVAEFAALTDNLGSPATWSGPPSDLGETILSRVRDLAAAPLAMPMPAQPSALPAQPPVLLAQPPALPAEPPALLAEPPALPAEPPAPPAEPPAAPAQPPAAPAQPPALPARRPGRWRSRWGRLTWAVPLAAVATAVFTVAVIAIDRTLLQGPPAGETYTATGTQLAPGAQATVTVVENPPGFSLRLLADGLPAAAEGSYYSAWLHGPRGVVPLGSFHQRRAGSPVALWSGVDPEDYTTLVITLQAEGEPPSPSNAVVMTADLSR